MAAWAENSPARGGPAEHSITALWHGAPPTAAPPGEHNSVPPGLGSCCPLHPLYRGKESRASAAGLHAPPFSAPAEPPLGRGGNLEVQFRLEASGPVLCLGLVLRCFPTTSGSPRLQLPGCSRISECQFPLPPALSVSPGPEAFSKPSASKTSAPAIARISKLRLRCGERGHGMKHPPSPPPSVPRPFSATTRRAAPDPRAACSRLKRLFYSYVIPDATQATPSPRPPGLRPTRRTQSHAVTYKTARRHSTASRRPTALHRRTSPSMRRPAISLANKPTRIHNMPQTHSGPQRHNLSTQPHTQTRTGAVPTTQSHNPPINNRIQTRPHTTQSLGDPETHSQLAARPAHPVSFTRRTDQK